MMSAICQTARGSIVNRKKGKLLKEILEEPNQPDKFKCKRCGREITNYPQDYKAVEVRADVGEACPDVWLFCNPQCFTEYMRKAFKEPLF